MPETLIIGAAHANAAPPPYFTLMKWDGTNLVFADQYVGLNGLANACKVSPNGKFIAIAHRNPIAGGNHITILGWDGTGLSYLAGHPLAGTGEGCAWSPDGRYIAAAHHGFVGDNFRIFEWDGVNLTQVATCMPDLALPGTGWGCCFSPDGQYIGVVHNGLPGFTRFGWDGSNLTAAGDFNLGNIGIDCRYSPNGEYIAIGQNGAPWFRLLRSNLTQVATFNAGGNVNGVSWHRDNEHIAIAHRVLPGFRVLNWDGSSLSLAASYTLPGVANNGTGCSFSSDGKYIGVTYNTPPNFFVLLGWDGSALTELDFYTLPGVGHDCHIQPFGLGLTFAPADLLCEQKKNPTDVTDPQPEFSAVHREKIWEYPE